MPESIREQIVKNVRETFEAITIAHGYSLDVVRVFEGFISPESLTQSGPWVSFEDRTTDYSVLNVAAMMTDLTIEAHGLMRHSMDGGEEAARQAGRRFLADLETAIMADQTRGGKAISTTPIASDVEALNPWVHVPITFVVKYRVSRRDPSSTC
jgi:hypothetical protein